MRLPKAIFAAALALPLVACQGNGLNTAFGGTGATVGTLGGGAAGGLLGAQFGGGTGGTLATIAGTLAGGYLGNQLGQKYDRNSRSQAAAAEQNAVATNQSTSWSNPNDNASGRVEPMRTFTDASGRTCREYQSVVNVQGESKSGTATACRQPNGDWAIANEGPASGSSTR